MRYINFLLLFLFSLLFSSASSAQSPVQELIDRAEVIGSSPGKLKQAIAEGKERATLCGYCHGNDGNSKRTDIPNLANQNPEYILRQFAKFDNGERNNYIMSQLVKVLSDEDRVNLALFYASSEVTARTTSHPERVSQGMAVYKGLCFACHGEQGAGGNDKPRLAGQPEDYIVLALTQFRQDDGTRISEVMTPIAKTITEDNIKAVAAYITIMGNK